MSIDTTTGTSERRRTAVTIVNYRTADLVLACLDSVIPQLDPARDVVVAVDNASGDGSVEALRTHVDSKGWPHVEVIPSPTNDGFAAGHNRAIRSVGAGNYLLLNSDTIVRDGCIAKLRAVLDAAADIGIVSPRLVDPDGTALTSCFRFHSPLSEVIRGSATGPIRRALSRADVPLPISEQATDVPWTSFAAVLVRAGVFDSAGLLDEGFFMYFEDEEFCRRAGRHGFRAHHEPAACVVHLEGGSTRAARPEEVRGRRPRYHYASRRRYFRDAYGRLGPLLANLGWTAGDLVARFRETFGRKVPHRYEHEFRDTWRIRGPRGDGVR